MVYSRVTRRAEGRLGREITPGEEGVWVVYGGKREDIARARGIAADFRRRHTCTRAEA